MRSHAPAIRKLLKDYPEGLVASSVARALNLDKDVASVTLKAMPDVYIDRWDTIRGQFTAVYCLADIPEDCPKPTRKPNEKDSTRKSARNESQPGAGQE